MRAVTIVDQTLQLVEHPDPDPGPGEVVLAVRAAGLASPGQNPSPPAAGTKTSAMRASRAARAGARRPTGATATAK